MNINAGVFMNATVPSAELARAFTNDPRWASVVARESRADGSLSGYRWGVERKQLLLNREAQA
jgi:hypothetical protein